MLARNLSEQPGSPVVLATWGSPDGRLHPQSHQGRKKRGFNKTGATSHVTLSHMHRCVWLPLCRILLTRSKSQFPPTLSRGHPIQGREHRRLGLWRPLRESVHHILLELYLQAKASNKLHPPPRFISGIKFKKKQNQNSMCRLSQPTQPSTAPICASRETGHGPVHSAPPACSLKSQENGLRQQKGRQSLPPALLRCQYLKSFPPLKGQFSA